MFAITIFNLTDTFFVSRLGTDALAAMGFTFPVVMIIGAISIGMASGAGSILARAMGTGDHHLMNRIATDGILLSIVMVVLFSVAGLLTLEPVFRALGATDETLPLVREYMVIWYLGSIAVIMPPVGDSAMRAMGDMTRPLVVMTVCAVVNLILDPILIFGLFGFPEMGIAGAALATVIARAAGMVTTLSFVHFRYGLIDFKYESAKELIESWKQILVIGLPVSMVRLFPQLLRAVLTRLAAAVGGVAAVAAVAAGSRVESFPLIISMAVGTAVMPLVGQNWGAGRIDRVDRARVVLIRTAVIYGLITFVLFIPAAGPIARIFTSDPDVLLHTQWYLWIMMLGTAGLHQYNWTSQALTAAGKPGWVVALNSIGTVAILIPLTLLGSRIAGYRGMLVGLAAGQLVLGYIAVILGRRQLSSVKEPAPR